MSNNINKHQIGIHIPLKSVTHISMYVLEKDQIYTVSAMWKKLESEIATVGLTATWEWTEAWLGVYGTLVDYWFVVGMKKNKVVGISIVTKETHRPIPIAVKAFHIGTYGEPFTDSMQMTNNRLLVTKECKTAFYRALVEAIQIHFHPEEIIFDELAVSEYDELQSVLHASGQSYVAEKHPMLFMNFDTLRKN